MKKTLFIACMLLATLANAAFDQLLVKSSTGVLIEVLMRSSTTGQPLTGLAVGDVSISYQRDGAASAVSLGTPAVLATLGSWETDAWKETGITGLYQYGVPNNAVLTGANGVTLVFTATGAITAKYRIVLTATNIQDSVRFGLTALPNAAADGLGGLPISDAGGLDLDTKLNHLNADIDSRAPSSTALSTATWTGTMAGYINASISGVPAATATAMMVTPVNKIATNASGYVTSTNGGDATAANQTTIINTLADIEGTSFSTLTDSLRAIRVRGDAAWTTGAISEGKVAVDHNTGGADAMRYTTSGSVPIAGATIRAYTTADYTAGTYTIRAKTTTTDTGRFTAPLYLDSGVSYTILFEKAGEYGPDAKVVTP
jgi:hypothetical protein